VIDWPQCHKTSEHFRRRAAGCSPDARQFGPVVTSLVHIGGVLLVFTYLIVPAVCGVYPANSLTAR
jgi:hypothetical protein